MGRQHTPNVGNRLLGADPVNYYAQASISGSRATRRTQATGGTKIPLSEARPGDILWRREHVAIYISGRPVHPRTADGRRLQDIERHLVLHVRGALPVKEERKWNAEQAHAHRGNRRGHRAHRQRRRALHLFTEQSDPEPQRSSSSRSGPKRAPEAPHEQRRRDGYPPGPTCGKPKAFPRATWTFKEGSFVR